MNSTPQLTPGAAQFLARLAAEPILAPSNIAETWVAALAAPAAAAADNSPSLTSTALEPMGDGFARLRVHGVMMRRPSAWERSMIGAIDTEGLQEAALEAMSPQIRGLILDIDSPGGLVVGGPEFAGALDALARTKPVVAWSSGHMASLAYWAGSQANVVMATPSAVVGSIGVIVAMRDFSRMLEGMGIRTEVIVNKEAIYKSIGVVGSSLSDAQRTHLQARVDDVYSDFKGAIRAHRQVQPSAMQGQTMSGSRGVSVGLIDRTGGFSDAMATLHARAARFLPQNQPVIPTASGSDALAQYGAATNSTAAGKFFARNRATIMEELRAAVATPAPADAVAQSNDFIPILSSGSPLIDEMRRQDAVRSAAFIRSISKDPREIAALREYASESDPVEAGRIFQRYSAAPGAR